MPIEISWEQASDNYENNKEKNEREYQRLIKEIEESNFSVLDARDINYYANELNDLSISLNNERKNKPYTPNEIRRINMDAQETNGFDYLLTFLDDDGDSIIDFY